MNYRGKIGLVLLVLALVLSGCNLPIAGNTTLTPTEAATPLAFSTATPAPQAGALAVVGWYGLVTALPEGSQFDDYVFLLSEGAGSVGIAGSDDAVSAQIDTLRANNTRAYFWGRLYCNVQDYNGCQLQTDLVLAEGAGSSNPTPISGWQGRLYATSDGSQFDDYFVLEGDWPIRYGIAVPPENNQEGAFSETLASYRSSGALLGVSGAVVCGVPDVNGCQIQVDELEELEPGTTSGSDNDPTGGDTTASEVVADWTGTIVRNGAGAAYTYAFQFWEAMRRVGITSVDGSVQQQIISLATGTGGGKVHIWGTLYPNDPASPDDDVIYVTAIEVEAPTAVPRQPTATPIVVSCALPARLQIGSAGRVAPGPLPNAVRSAPGTSSGSVVLGNIPGGTVFTVLEGPACRDGYNWWRVNANGFVGWTAEGQNSTYWLDPLTCGNGLSIRMIPGATARVTLSPAVANVVRTQPGRGNGAVIGEIPPGGIFTVLSGPECDSGGMAWWRVNYNGLLGWTGEGESGVYWLEPYAGNAYELVTDLRGTISTAGIQAPANADDYFELHSTSGATVRYGIASTDPAIAQQIINLRNTGRLVRISGQLRREVPDYNSTQINVTQLVVESTEPVVCNLPVRLSAGYSARVTEGLPNTVRTAPGTSASTAQSNLPGGTIFRIIEGPRCVEGYNWWRITTGNVTGWTAEGQGSTYWLEPLACGNGLRSQQVPGLQGRVTFNPPLANTVRSEPRTTSQELGEIPPGGVFTVLSGPQCGPEGMLWWQVNYNGLIGWTAEGVPGQYWLEPVN